jgi:DNA-binding transcriptional regulator GbsR (MarR family)
MGITKEEMPETMYRASRCCRVLGNPAAYLVVRCLGRKRKTPTELSEELQVSLPSVSKTLRDLRLSDLVRYETKGITKQYWVKDKKVLKILDSLEQWVESTRQKRV